MDSERRGEDGRKTERQKSSEREREREGENSHVFSDVYRDLA